MTLRGAVTAEHLAAIVAASRRRGVVARVLSLGPGVHVVLATQSIDLRRGHDGLVTLVRSLWKADPYSGTLFVFLGPTRSRSAISAAGPRSAPLALASQAR